MSEPFYDPTTLCDRLRGIYRIPIRDGLGPVGGGDEPENPDQFVRSFTTAPIQHEAARRIRALEAENARLRNALCWYADPEIYRPHPHGPAFDRRDLSFLARAELGDDA